MHALRNFVVMEETVEYAGSDSFEKNRRLAYDVASGNVRERIVGYLRNYYAQSAEPYFPGQFQERFRRNVERELPSNLSLVTVQKLSESRVRRDGHVAIVTVKGSSALTGGASVYEDLLDEARRLRRESGALALSPGSRGKKKPTDAADEQTGQGDTDYTCIIIDATKSQVRMGLFPRLVGKNRQVVFSPFTEPDYLGFEFGAVRFAGSLEEARGFADFVGEKPLFLRTEDAPGETPYDVVLRESDVEKIRGVESRTGLLRRGRIIIVVREVME